MCGQAKNLLSRIFNYFKKETEDDRPVNQVIWSQKVPTDMKSDG